MKQKDHAMLLEEFFDRRLPLAIVAALCLQAGGIVWWAATREADAHFQQNRIDHIEQNVTETHTSQTEMLERLARIEERVTEEARLLEIIRRQLEERRR